MGWNSRSSGNRLETFIKKRPLLADTEGGGSAASRRPGEMGDVTVDGRHCIPGAIREWRNRHVRGDAPAPGRKNYNRWEINGEKGSIAFNLEADE